MKTSILTILLILMLSVPFASAQKTAFGILGGVNFQNLNGKDDSGDKLDYDLLVGFHAGVNAQISVAPDFYFQPGLLFSTKGASDKVGSTTTKIKISYLELPLNFVYKPLVGKGHFMLGFGPYLAFGIGGKVSAGGTSSDIKFKSTVKTSDDPETFYLRAFDAGANIFAGYEFSNKIFCQLNTQLGLLKVNPDYDESPNSKASVKNTGFGLSVGYRF